MSETKTHIAFDNAFFKAVAAGYFRLSEHTKDAVFVIRYENSEAALSLRGIKGEFGIAADSEDSRMLDVVAKGLQFVPILRIGDPVPKELLTGEASWSVTDRHRQVALQRLTLQLIGWWSGAETAITDPQQLVQIAEDPEMRRRASEAFEKAAQRLSLDRATIESLIGQLAGELAYVEALRERLDLVRSMFEKAQTLRRRYADERSVQDLAAAVVRLMTLALKEFTAAFDNLDAQTSEILAALKNVQGQKKFLQQSRDVLYARLRAWDDLLEDWRKAEPRRGADKPDLLRTTYQFLAPRFMPSEEWILASKLTPTNLADANGRRVIPNSIRW